MPSWLKKTGANSPATYNLLALIILLSTLLRIINLTANSYWADEIFTVNQVLRNVHLPGLIQGVLRFESGPPLYQIILFFHIRLFGHGHSELVVRGLSAAFGVLTVLFFYFLTAQLFNRRRGLMGVLFLAVAYLPIYYAQEARPYALLLCLTVLSNWLFVRIFFPKDRSQPPPAVGAKADIPLYFLASLFLILSHYYGLLILLFQILFLIIMAGVRYLSWKRFFKWLFFYAALAIVYWFLWGHNLLAQYNNQLFNWIPKPKSGVIISFVDTVLRPNLGGRNWLNLIWLGLLILGLAYSLNKVFKVSLSAVRPQKRAALKLVFSYLWLLMPFLVAYGQSVWGKSSLMPRNLIIISPALFLSLLISGEIIMALSLKKIYRGSFREIYLKSSLIMAAGVALLIFLGSTFNYYLRPVKNDYRGVVSAVMEESPQLFPRPLIFCTSGFAGEGLNYYFIRARSSLRVLEELNDGNYQNVFTKYRQNFSRDQYLVLIVLQSPGHKKVLDDLKMRANLLLKRKLTGISYYVFTFSAASEKP